MYVRSAAVIAIASAAAGDCPPSSGVTGPMTVMRRSGPVLIAIMVSLHLASGAYVGLLLVVVVMLGLFLLRSSCYSCRYLAPLSRRAFIPCHAMVAGILAISDHSTPSGEGPPASPQTATTLKNTSFRHFLNLQTRNTALVSKTCG